MKKSFILGLLLGGTLLSATTLDECIAANKAGAYKKAESLCTKAIKENPKSYDANFFLMKTNYTIGNFNKALSYAQKLEQLSTSLNEYGLSYNYLSAIYNYLGDKRLQLKYSLKSLEINKKLGNKNKIGSSLHNLGTYYLNVNDLNEAQKYYLEALEYETDKASTYNSLSILNFKLNNQEKSLEYAKKAVAFAKETSNFSSYSNYLSTLASVYIETKNYDLAKSSLLEALQIAQDKGLLSQQSYALKYLGYLSENQKDKESAKKYYKQALQISKSQENSSEIEDLTALLNQIGE